LAERLKAEFDSEAVPTIPEASGAAWIGREWENVIAVSPSRVLSPEEDRNASEIFAVEPQAAGFKSLPS
jgi:hypothetical protein